MHQEWEQYDKLYYCNIQQNKQNTEQFCGMRVQQKGRQFSGPAPILPDYSTKLDHRTQADFLKHTPFQILPFDTSAGELPIRPPSFANLPKVGLYT